MAGQTNVDLSEVNDDMKAISSYFDERVDGLAEMGKTVDEILEAQQEISSNIDTLMHNIQVMDWTNAFQIKQLKSGRIAYQINWDGWLIADTGSTIGSTKLTDCDIYIGENFGNILSTDNAAQKQSVEERAIRTRLGPSVPLYIAAGMQINFHPVTAWTNIDNVSELTFVPDKYGSRVIPDEWATDDLLNSDVWGRFFLSSSMIQLSAVHKGDYQTFYEDQKNRDLNLTGYDKLHLTMAIRNMKLADLNLKNPKNYKLTIIVSKIDMKGSSYTWIKKTIPFKDNGYAYEYRSGNNYWIDLEGSLNTNRYVKLKFTATANNYESNLNSDCKLSKKDQMVVILADAVNYMMEVPFKNPNAAP